MKAIKSTVFSVYYHRLLVATLMGTLFAVPATQAQQNPGAPQTPNYAPPANYNGSSSGAEPQKPKATARIGNFVRNLFYGELGSRGNTQDATASPGRSLDGPPPSTFRPSPDAPPAGATSTRSQAASKPAPAPPKPSVKKPVTQYEPPKIKESPSAPNPSPAPKPKVNDAPPPPEIQKQAPLQPVEETPKTEEPPNSDQVLIADGPAPKTELPAPPLPTKDESVPAKEEPKTTPPTENNNQFLVGKKTAVPGRVISPYPPHQELDVSGLSSGSLALDPTTNKVFQIP